MKFSHFILQAAICWCSYSNTYFVNLEKRLLEILLSFFFFFLHTDFSQAYLFWYILYPDTSRTCSGCMYIYARIQGLVHHQLKYEFNLCPHKLMFKHWLQVWGWDGTQQVAQAKINYIYAFYKGGNLGDMGKSDYICYLHFVK